MISHYSTKSTISTIIQNTIFTFTLNGKELEKKNLFITIMNGKILICFITLH